MNACSTDIKEMLEYYLNSSNSEASSSDFELFPVTIGKETSTPNNLITLFDTVGSPPQLTMDKREKYEYKGVQIRIRAISYVGGWAQAEEIKDVLHGRANEQWGGVYYSLIRVVNGPYLLDFDKNQRPRFIINLDCQRRQF